MLLNRAPSLVIDMDIPSLPATRATSPSPVLSRSTAGQQTSAQSTSNVDDARVDDADVKAQRSGLGTLMKSAKKDVKVAEFDMNAFF